MREFENYVQKVKNEVYTEVARHAFAGDLEEKQAAIANELNPGPNPRFRCCVYHERAVTAQRVQCTLAGSDGDQNVVQVLGSACAGCTPNRYTVSDLCRGCIAHRCRQSCPVGAISIVDQKAVIDHDKCIECGRCQAACPYNAIADSKRPCMRACPVNAISASKYGQAEIDDSKCIRCGACVQMCPFGALQDRSNLVRVIRCLTQKTAPVIAMVAPSVADAFGYTQVGKVVTAIRKLGFQDVVEVALGADLAIQQEAEEFVQVLEEDGVMTSSCCPAFVRFLQTKYPQLQAYVSHTVSPMLATAQCIKSLHPNCVTVFIGPCIAKKEEGRHTAVDYVLTFEELAGMIDLDAVDAFEESPLNNASYYGRKFAVSGGVANALQQQLCLRDDVWAYDVIRCEGFDEIEKTLRLLKAGKLKRTFIEGMACRGGCVKGPASIHFGKTDTKAFERYCSLAHEKDPQAATKVFR